MGRVINELGNKYGRLTVVAPSESKFQRRTAWVCLCECGTTTALLCGVSLRNGVTKSCGCLRLEAITTHGKTKSKPYAAYENAMARCRSNSYRDTERYKGRGIEFRFDSFEEFWAELKSTYEDGLTLGRIENNGHYEKGNVRWVTQAARARNRATNVWFTFKGERKIQKDWCKEFGVTLSYLKSQVALHGAGVAFTKFAFMAKLKKEKK